MLLSSAKTGERSSSRVLSVMDSVSSGIVLSIRLMISVSTCVGYSLGKKSGCDGVSGRLRRQWTILVTGD